MAAAGKLQANYERVLLNMGLRAGSKYCILRVTRVRCPETKVSGKLNFLALNPPKSCHCWGRLSSSSRVVL